MKKTLIALALLALFNNSYAGGYSDVVAVQAFCKNAAETGKFVYDSRDRHPKQYYTDSYDNKVEGTGKEAMANEAMLRAINYSYDKATDEKDAYMGAWAACMDTVNK